MSSPGFSRVRVLYRFESVSEFYTGLSPSSSLYRVSHFSDWGGNQMGYV